MFGMPTLISDFERSRNRVAITAVEFGRMQDACVFRDRHVQLLDGELYEVTKNPPHNQAVTALASALRAILSPERYQVREEKSIEPWDNWWPEPDIAVVRARSYWNRHPGTADIVLLAEVCDNSEQDRTKKLAGYAAAGVPTYWGPSPIRAKTYGKDGRRGPVSARSSAKSPHFQPSPRNIAHNFGVQSAVCAISSGKPTYCAQ